VRHPLSTSPDFYTLPVRAQYPTQYTHSSNTPLRITYYANSFRVAVSIHNFVYNRCANWMFHGIGCESFPSAVVSTNTLFKWKVAVCASSSVVTSIEKRPSLGRCSELRGESPHRTITCHVNRISSHLQETAQYR